MRTQVIDGSSFSFALLGFRFWKNKSFLQFLSWYLVDPDFRFPFF